MRKDLIALNKRILTPLLKKSKIPKNNSLYRELKTTLSNIPEVKLENEAGSFHLTLPDTHMKMSIISGTLCAVVYRIYNSSQDYNSNKYTEYTQICDTSGSCIHIDLQSILNVENTYVDIVLINEKELHFNYQINNCIFVLKSVLYKISDIPLTSSKKHTVIAYTEDYQYKEDIITTDMKYLVEGDNNRLFCVNYNNDYYIYYSDDNFKTKKSIFLYDYNTGIQVNSSCYFQNLRAFGSVIIATLSKRSTSSSYRYTMYIAISKDNGDTWIVKSVGTSYGTVNNFNNSIFGYSNHSINYKNGIIIIGTGLNYIYTTDYGETITVKKLNFPVEEYYDEYNFPELDKDDPLILQKGSTLLISNDAEIWEERTLPTSNNLNIFHVDNTFILIPIRYTSKDTEFTIYYSTDNLVTLNQSKYISKYSLDYSSASGTGDNTFIKPLHYNNTWLLMTTIGEGIYSDNNMKTWNHIKLDADDICKPIYANGLWLCFPNSSSYSTQKLNYSKDNCKTWKSVELTPMETPYQNYPLNPQYHNGLFLTIIRATTKEKLASEGNSSAIAYSYDGINWMYKYGLINEATSSWSRYYYSNIYFINKQWLISRCYERRAMIIKDLLNTPITEVT